MSLIIPDPNKPSQKQLAFLHKLGYLGRYDKLTAQEAAQIIDELVEEHRMADKPANYYDDPFDNFNKPIGG